jgi:hypothetical protein
MIALLESCAAAASHLLRSLPISVSPALLSSLGCLRDFSIGYRTAIGCCGIPRRWRVWKRATSAGAEVAVYAAAVKVATISDAALRNACRPMNANLPG